jgi:feruloyl esterase
MKVEQCLLTSLLSAPTVLASPAGYPGTKNGTDFETKCADIASKLAIEHSTVHFSEFVTAGTNLSLSDNDPSCTQSSIVVPADICRIALSVATSNRSGLNMEAWLPSNWTGRFLSGGNGGLNGCVDYDNLAYTSGLGFSSVGTNNGHNGTGGQPFLNNSEVVEDFAYRA